MTFFYAYFDYMSKFSTALVLVENIGLGVLLTNCYALSKCLPKFDVDDLLRLRHVPYSKCAKICELSRLRVMSINLLCCSDESKAK